jgi:hypothetical protein
VHAEFLAILSQVESQRLDSDSKDMAASFFRADCSFPNTNITTIHHEYCTSRANGGHISSPPRYQTRTSSLQCVRQLQATKSASRLPVSDIRLETDTSYRR